MSDDEELAKLRRRMEREQADQDAEIQRLRERLKADGYVFDPRRKMREGRMTEEQQAERRAAKQEARGGGRGGS
ncbi:MAG TPA: hypothetical protein VEX39_03535 [Thermoleophilaceae bacterium]|nr:hypothetical protein [Thermoleophilaceae bacterium]